ncbi:MAG: peptidyl-tRNA hydrolase Pth2 [Candidatus Altiarchaeota archaeon]
MSVTRKIMNILTGKNKTFKQVIVVRSDLKLSKGKLAAQVAHAAVTAADKSQFKADWMREGQKKSVVKCKSLDELISLKERADRKRISTALIEDAGHTQIPSGTVTCLGIGPAKEGEIDAVTGGLKLL